MRLGKLHLIMGPMYSGKTSELIRLANRAKIIGKKILSINHKSNDRYDGKICSHDRNSFEHDIKVFSLNEIGNLENYNNPDIIIIDELQFYDDCYNWIINVLDNNNIEIICSCLNGDFKRENFNSILGLIPHAEEITKLSALCVKCNDGTNANYSKRIIKNDEQKLVGSTEAYIAVCRYHYLHDN